MTNRNREYWAMRERERKLKPASIADKANSIMILFAVIGGLLIVSVLIPVLTLLVGAGLFVVFGLAVFSFIVMAIRHIVSPTSGSPKGVNPAQRTTSRNQ